MATQQTKKSNESQSPGNIYDAFVKRMFGQLLVIVDFLLHYADRKFVDAVDLTKITPAPTHYIGKEGDERIVDLMFLCPLKNGRGTMMAVIVFEHQSGSLKKIPQKLHKNISAIWTAETKEGKKILSAPYFIVLRTAKKPHRGPYPKMRDSLPKDENGRPVGKAVEVEYDVVDLPAYDLHNLVGGPALRVALGILKTMVEEAGEDFAKALLPLLEISDEEQKIDLTKEVLPFVAKVFAARKRRLDETMVSKALKPIFQNKEFTMMKTIFEEKYDMGFAEGEAKGRAEGKAEGEAAKGKSMLLKILHAKFHRIPKDVEHTILSMTDPTALDSWAEHALACQSMDEFAQAIR